jgi:hypothetical protein
MLELRQVYSLYDNDKVKQPKLDGKDETFDKVDSVVLEALTKAQAANKKIVVFLILILLLLSKNYLEI